MKNIILYILLSSISTATAACDVPNWSLNQWLEKADAAYYGQVISLAVAKESSNFEDVFEEASPSLIDRDVKFKVLSEIKAGKIKAVEIEAALSWCGGGEVEFLGKAVFIVKNGYWTSFNKKEDIEWFLSNNSNKK